MALTKVKGHIIADDLALGGNPTTSTQSTGNNTTRLATTAFVQTELAALADSAPSTLNTLNELAAALGDDASFSTTVTDSIALKAPLASPTFTGTAEIPNLTISGAQGTDGQLLTSTGSGIAWEDAPASGPTFKTFGTDSIMIGDDATGTINGANKNVGLGVNVFSSLTTGDNNVAVGYDALSSLQSQGGNVAIGYQAGKSVVSGYENIFIGLYTGINAVHREAIAIGSYSMYSNIGTTNGDIGIGLGAMQYKNASLGNTIAIGTYAHRGGNTTTGRSNIAIGPYAMQSITTGTYNTAVGDTALNDITTGTYNVVIGQNAGAVITTGSKNVVIGHYDGNENGLDIRTSSNNIVLSDGDANIRMRIDSSGNVGIGNTNPSSKLTVQGALSIRNATQNFNGGLAAEVNTGIMNFGINEGSGNRFGGSYTQANQGGMLNFDTRSGEPLFQIYGRAAGTANASGTALLNILSDGKVGINQLAPGQWLSVKGTSDDQISLDGNAANSNVGIFFKEEGANKWEIYHRGADNHFSFYNYATGDRRMVLRSDGGLALGANNVGYSSQILSVNAGAADTVFYGESTDANCFASFRDNSSNTNVEVGAIGNDHVFRNDSTEKWRMQASNGWLIGQSASQVRLVLGSTGSSSNNTSNWIRGDGSNLGRNTPGDHIWEVNGSQVMRLDADGLKFGTDTAAVNGLDDYEEGGWIPALQNVTTNSISYYALYTKIGRICHIHAKITATVASLPGANFAISGLPFAAKDSSDSQQRALISIGGDTQNVGSYGNGRAHFRTAGSQLQGVWLNSGSTAYWNYNSMDHTTFEIHVHGHYTV